MIRSGPLIEVKVSETLSQFMHHETPADRAFNRGKITFGEWCDRKRVEIHKEVGQMLKQAVRRIKRENLARKKSKKKKRKAKVVRLV